MKYYFKVFKKYAIFYGRAGRSECGYFILFNVIISAVLVLIAVVTDRLMLVNASSIALFIAAFFSFLSMSCVRPSMAAAVRRMHDVGKSGWYSLIPVYNLVLALSAGEKGENKYGTDPTSDQP